jgi:hypothetical protein
MLIVDVAPTALSLHQDDGTMPRFIAASIPNISKEQKTNEGLGGEKFHLLSA